MELPKKELGHRGATLKEIAVKHLLDSGDNHPCDHIDKLLANEDLYEDVYDDLKNGFCEKYKGCLPDRKIYRDNVKKLIIKNNNIGLYVLEQCCIKKLNMQSGIVLHVVEEYEPLHPIQIRITDAISNNEIIISGTTDGLITLWNAKDSQCITKLDNEKEVVTLAAEHKDYFCSVSQEKIKIWDIESGQCFSEVGRHNDNNYNAPCILKNDTLYVASTKMNYEPVDNDNDLVAYDLRSSKRSILFDSMAISSIVGSVQCPFSFFSGSHVGGVSGWDMRKASKPVHVVETNYSVKALAINDKTLYVALEPGYGDVLCHPGIQVFDIQHKNLSLVNNLPGEGSIHSLQANNEGLYVAGTAGLTFLHSRSYQDVYNTVKKVNAQKVLEYSKK